MIKRSKEATLPPMNGARRTAGSLNGWFRQDESCPGVAPAIVEILPVLLCTVAAIDHGGMPQFIHIADLEFVGCRAATGEPLTRFFF